MQAVHEKSDWRISVTVIKFVISMYITSFVIATWKWQIPWLSPNFLSHFFMHSLLKGIINDQWKNLGTLFPLLQSNPHKQLMDGNWFQSPIFLILMPLCTWCIGCLFSVELYCLEWSMFCLVTHVCFRCLAGTCLSPFFFFFLG